MLDAVQLKARAALPSAPQIHNALPAAALQRNPCVGTVKVRQDALAGYVRSAELADKIEALTGEVPLHRKLVHGLSSVADDEVLLAAAYRHAMALLSDRPKMCKDKAARAGLDKARAEAATAAPAATPGDPGNAEDGDAGQSADQSADDGFEDEFSDDDFSSKQDQDRSATAEPYATVLQPAIDIILAEQQKRGTLQQQLGTQVQHISELEQKCAELSTVNSDMSSQLAAVLADLSRLKAAACGACSTLGEQALTANYINPTTTDYERCLQQAAAAAKGRTDILSSDIKLLQGAVYSAYSTLMGEALQGDSFTAAALEQHLQQAAAAAAQKIAKLDAMT
jgi:hypothetical protein